MLRAIVRWTLFVPAALLAGFALSADAAWFARHVQVPCYYTPPPASALAWIRAFAAALALAFVGCAVAAGRRATAGGVLRVSLALLLAVCAAEAAVRHLPPPRYPRLESLLGAPDPRTGWAFVPRRALEWRAGPATRMVRYSTDAHGDRGPSVDWVEDPRAPTLVVTGESIATGHGLEWSETFPALVGRRLGLQVVDVAEGGYGSDQAHLRALDALARLERPIAVVSTFMPVQLYRNVRRDRPHLELRDGALVLLPARRSRLALEQLLVDELPYLSEARLQDALALTRTILHATAEAARARGARPLFVVPSIGPKRPLDARPEAFVVHALLDDLPHVVIDLDRERILAWDGHPDPEGAREIADAIVAALQ